MDSGFYKLEDNSYEYVCGGKIQVGGLISKSESSVTLSVAELQNKSVIGTDLLTTSDNPANNNPKTYIKFYNKDSIQVIINALESLKLILNDMSIKDKNKKEA